MTLFDADERRQAVVIAAAVAMHALIARQQPGSPAVEFARQPADLISKAFDYGNQFVKHAETL